jgi:hypothetical protein
MLVYIVGVKKEVFLGPGVYCVGGLYRFAVTRCVLVVWVGCSHWVCVSGVGGLYRFAVSRCVLVVWVGCTGLQSLGVCEWCGWVVQVCSHWVCVSGVDGLYRLQSLGVC